MKKFNVPISEKFWCSECDLNLVDAQDEETGQFFSCWGHIWNGKEIGEYHRVIFAVCTQCLKDENAT